MHLQAALEQFAAIAEDLGEGGERDSKIKTLSVETAGALDYREIVSAAKRLPMNEQLCLIEELLCLIEELLCSMRQFAQSIKSGACQYLTPRFHLP